MKTFQFLQLLLLQIVHRTRACTNMLDLQAASATIFYPCPASTGKMFYILEFLYMVLQEIEVVNIKK